jgi:hypothetical protein
MNSAPFSRLVQNIADYFPSLLAGIVLIIIGAVAGWLFKRIVYQLCVLLRIERLLGSFRWGGEFSKADIRHALFRTIGNVAFLIVFMIFLNAALDAMKLSVLSNMIEKGVSFIPRLIAALFIFSIGWIIARGATVSIRRALYREGVRRGSLIARFANAVILLFFFSMALVELDIARTLVIIGFSVIIITLALLAVIFATLGGKDLVKKTVESLEDTTQDADPE